MHFLLSLFTLIILSLLLMLPRLQQIEIPLIVFLLLGRATVQRPCFKCTLHLHIVGLNKRSRDMDMFALLQTILLLIEFQLTLGRLRDLAGHAHLPILTTGLHPNSGRKYSSSFLRFASS